MNWTLALLLWYAVLAALLWQAKRDHAPLAGLSLCYWLNLASHHLVSETLCLFHDNQSEFRPWATLGFGVSGYAMVGLLLSVLLSARLRPARPPSTDLGVRALADTSGPPMLAVGTGLAVFVSGSVVATLLIPGLSAMVFTGNMLAAAGFSWWWLRERTHKRYRTSWLVLVMSLIVPLITLVVLGFMAYGIFTLMAVVAFVYCHMGVRARHIFLGIPAIYMVLSVGMTYMAGKNSIRSSVWGGDSTTERVAVVADNFDRHFTFFDPYDGAQRLSIDLRFNQNYFVGLATHRLESGQLDYWYGRSLADGFLALIPRSVWSEKPPTTGGTELMHALTGLPFVEGVSFGIGHVIDMYINFGPIGSVVGFFIYGMIIYYFDRLAGRAVACYSFDKFITWYLPGTALVNGAVGRLAEVSPGLIGGFGLAFLFLLVARRLLPKKALPST